MAKKIFIITGDYSADIHASAVAREIKKLIPDAIIEGVGSTNLENAGVKLFKNHDKMGQMGLTPKVVIEHLFMGLDIVKYLKNEFRPDLVLLIDYGAFNLQISKALKKAGIKTFFFIPPQVWASRKYRLKTIKKNIDKVLTIFPFEEEFYKEAGIDSTYVGHPIVSELPTCNNKEEFFARHGFDKNKKLVSVFPGSRVFELKQLMNIFIKSAKKLQKAHPDLQFCISHAPNLSDEVYSKYIKDTDFKVIKGENQALLSCSDALILASGTVALEACLYQVPMIIAYRGPWLLYLIYLMVRCIKKVSLPNIIADRMIVPEIIQGKVTVQNISYQIEKTLYNNSYREDFIRQLGEVKELLSDKISSKEAANVIVQELCNNS